MYFFKRELAALLLLGGALPMSAVATDTGSVYPQRPITLVVGFTAGGGTDSLARLLARHMQEELRQKVLIDNRPGAASNVAAEFVSRAMPDGYTLYISGRPNTIHKTMYGHLKFDIERDLIPVGLLATVPNVIVTGSASPVKSLHDAVALAKAYPGDFSCASSGVGSNGHLLCELLKQESGTDILHIPYRGSAPALADVIGGRVDLLISVLPAALPYIKAGSVRPIAIMSRRRASTLPDVPTAEEIGFSNLDVDTWFGLMAPKSTPPDVIARLNGAINSILMQPTLQEAFTELGYVAPLRPNTPENLGRLTAEETAKWTEILRKRNIGTTR
jgi:tripartite-type tricarboxylate transporter receptor subunit TctC